MSQDILRELMSGGIMSLGELMLMLRIVLLILILILILIAAAGTIMAKLLTTTLFSTIVLIIK